MAPDDNQDPSGPSDESVEPQPAETPAGSAAPSVQRHRPSTDEALAEMRRSLREEETQEKTGFRASVSRLAQRLFARKPKPPSEAALEAAPEPLDFPEAPSRLDIPVPPQEAPTPAPEEQAPVDQAPPPVTPPASEPTPAEFGALVRTRLTEAFEPKEEVQPSVPARSILASIRPEDQETEQDTASLRQEALEDYVLTPEEPEEVGRPTLMRSVRRWWKYLRPTERRLLMGSMVVIGLAALIGSGYLVVKSLPAPTPGPTATLSILPVPSTVSLPGGWVFPLRTGYVINGKWSPSGPEWLQGTEICRWISLPWSVQLEAVVRTLKADDEIKVSMTNYDILVYKVKSIEQVPSGQIANLAPDTPSLLLILSKKDSDDRWVVTAKP